MGLARKYALSAVEMTIELKPAAWASLSTLAQAVSYSVSTAFASTDLSCAAYSSSATV